MITITRTQKLTTRYGGIVVAPDGTMVGSTELVDELGGSTDTLRLPLDKTNFPQDLIDAIAKANAYAEQATDAAALARQEKFAADVAAKGK